MLTLQNLLSNGYFPRELPPPFSTNAFASVVATGAGIDPGFKAKRRGSVLCVHNLVRSGGLRRNLGIPNPVSYTEMCEFVVRRWADLQAASNRSPFSLTKPVDTKSFRAISATHNLSDRTLRRIELRSRARFILRADVNRFYPSLYTHSLPWAIHTKAVVKAAKAAGTLKTLWSDELDTLARNLNDQQTMGIPIGPDCSLVMAEIVLAAVDEELASMIPGIRGIRFIDDYEFAVNEQSQAEHIASSLQSILNHYELALNPSKTRVIELPDCIEPLWTSRLRTFLFRNAGTVGQRNDLTAYFDLAFTFARQEADEGILKYAIPRLNAVDVEETNWPMLEALLGQCAAVEPACLPQVCEQIVHYSSLSYRIDKGLWDDVLNRIVGERLQLGQASEAVWAMWLMKLLGISLATTSESAVNDTEDSAAALMGLGLASTGLATRAAMSGLDAFAEPDDLFGPQWLLCYEGVYRGWISPKSGAKTLAAHKQFKFLQSKGVSFFDIGVSPPVPRRTHVPAGSVGSGGDYPF